LKIGFGQALSFRKDVGFPVRAVHGASAQNFRAVPEAKFKILQSYFTRHFSRNNNLFIMDKAKSKSLLPGHNCVSQNQLKIAEKTVLGLKGKLREKTHNLGITREIGGGAGNTFLKLFSNPNVCARIVRIKEILESEG
jgi:hypothetical protein